MAEFSPEEVVIALEPLSNAKAQELFFHLGMALNTMDNIKSNYDGNMHKIRIAQEWINNDFEASWEKLAEGLKKIGMKVLAAEIASKSNEESQTSTTTSTNRRSPNPSLTSAQPAQFLGYVVTQPPATTSPTRASPIPSSTSAQPAQLSVSQVKDAIEDFEDKFSDLMSDTRAEMCARESKDSDFLDKFRDRLLVLPIAKKHVNAVFFRKSEDEILDARNIRKIFAILTRHCTFRNYEILFHLLKKFGSDELKQRMSDFCASLEKFESTTPIDIYATAISANAELLQAFSEMAAKLGKPASQCPLCELRKLADLANQSSPDFMTAYLLPMLSVTETPGDC